MAEKVLWHTVYEEEAVRILGVDLSRGLPPDEVEHRQKKFGKNALAKTKPVSSAAIFISQFKNIFAFILIIAGSVAFLLKSKDDASVIFFVVIINAIFGFWEERKAVKSFEKLRNAIVTRGIVIRDGHKKEITQEEIVPGDILLLNAGDRVPADGRLIEACELKVTEAMLTGEWLAASKNTSSLPQDTPLADRNNMIYAGSLVESGHARAVVTATGLDTELGRIAASLEEIREEKTPIQKKLLGFSRTAAVLIICISVFIFAGNIFRANSFLESFESAVAIAVAGIPEALPIVMTVILALGAERILKRRGLMRKLASVETLGSAQVLCFDKTLTLTQGKMEVAEILAEDKEFTLKIAVLCSRAFVENPNDYYANWRIHGNPTDMALLRAGAENGVLSPAEEDKSREIEFMPFTAALKYQLSLRREGEKTMLYMVGAPEVVLAACISPKDHWNEKLDKLTRRGYRVIGLGHKELGINAGSIKNEVHDLKFAGFMAFEDPLREGVKDVMQICKKAGMLAIMITGDHRATAQTIAEKAGIKCEAAAIIEGTELDKLSDDDFKKIVEKIRIYARTEPRHKTRIIKAWQEKGKVVAMTGDGVNDAPALKKADIGVALGSGTEAAKESADLVLLDDSFSTLVAAVEEGRVILDNLRKGITYVMANSFSEAIIVGTATIFGWPLPILAVQILWNNIVEDSLPNIALAFEPKEKGIMDRPPNPSEMPLLTKEMKVLIFGTGIVYEAFGLLLFYVLWFVLHLELEYVRTMVFGLLVINTAFVVFSYRSLRKNIWQYNPFSNKILNMAVVAILLIFAASIYLPIFQRFLHTVEFGVLSWVVLAAISLASVALIEITKWLFNGRAKATA